MAGDLGAVALAISVAAAARNERWAGDEVTGLLAVLLPLYAVIALNLRAFAHDAIERWVTGLRRALTSLVYTILLLIAVGFALKVSSHFSRLVLTGGVAAAGFTILVTRYLTRSVIRRILPDGVIDVVLLMDGLCPAHAGNVRRFDATTLGLRPSLDSPKMLDRIGKALQGCDRVILACLAERRQTWAVALKGLGIEVHVLMPELDALGLLGMARFDDQLAGVIARGPLRMSDMVLKRAFDIAFVIFCLPITSLVIGAVAVLIKLDDGGPVFFSQNRIGQGNRIFSMRKFRSMRVDTSDQIGTVSTFRGDVRITRVGYWLRRTSIDELPQLFNVLIGDMSIVGPRPHALASTAEEVLFWDADSRYWLRHAVRPGLTGLAQVRGFRGATHKTSDLTDRVQADLEYLVGWTLWRDIRIVFGTMKVLFHPNAF